MPLGPWALQLPGGSPHGEPVAQGLLSWGFRVLSTVKLSLSMLFISQMWPPLLWDLSEKVT